MSDAERWRAVIGYEGFYEVSDRGRVRSAARQGTDGRVLALHVSRPCGYVRTRLYRGGRGAGKKVHRLVLDAFVGPCPVGHEACHNNGDRADNRLPNLRWGTRPENCADAKRHGTAAVRDRNGQSKLSSEKVEIAKALRQRGFSYSRLARTFNVTSGTIRSAIVGETWR